MLNYQSLQELKGGPGSGRYPKGSGNNDADDVNSSRWQHGTDFVFEEFDDAKIGTRTDPGFFGQGHYLTEASSGVAARWGSSVIDADVEVENPLLVRGITEFDKLSERPSVSSIRAKNPSLSEKEAFKLSSQIATKNLKAKGYDSVLYIKTDGSRQLIVFSGDKIKITGARKKSLELDQAIQELDQSELKSLSDAIQTRVAEEFALKGGPGSGSWEGPGNPRFTHQYTDKTVRELHSNLPRTPGTKRLLRDIEYGISYVADMSPEQAQQELSSAKVNWETQLTELKLIAEGKLEASGNFFRDWEYQQGRHGRPLLQSEWATNMAVPEAESMLRSIERTSQAINKISRKHQKLDQKSLKGGPGSGNFGHEGRPGEVGGSGASLAEDIGGEEVELNKPLLVFRIGREDENDIANINAGNAVAVADHMVRMSDDEGPRFKWETGDTISVYEVTFLAATSNRSVRDTTSGKYIKYTLSLSDNYSIKPLAKISLTQFNKKLGYPNADYAGIRHTAKVLRELINDDTKSLKGGSGSGNFGHSGRPGLVGGSGEGDGSSISEHDRWALSHGRSTGAAMARVYEEKIGDRFFEYGKSVRSDPAVKGYMNYGHKAVDGLLRDGSVPEGIEMPPSGKFFDEKSTTDIKEGLDKLFSKAPVMPEGSHVFAGTSADSARNMFDLKPRDVISDLSFRSTTTNPSVASEFSRAWPDGKINRALVIKIESDGSLKGIGGFNKPESEILLDRGLKFRVIRNDIIKSSVPYKEGSIRSSQNRARHKVLMTVLTVRPSK